MADPTTRPQDVAAPLAYDWIDCACPVTTSLLSRVRSVAATRATVLLTGETGVGKSVIARLIHNWSPRRELPFVPVHCGAIPDTLVESELFGHEKGAFTGAHRRTMGKFESADGGTLFLDEVGTITPSAQVKLLDVLQERRFHRVGGKDDVQVDVRIVAASNDDLQRMRRDGAFRTDLFHRLNVFPIDVPPLRERSADLARLVAQLLERFNGLYAKRIEGLDPIVDEAFRAYPWPGNVRELENVIERACILEASVRISPSSIPSEILAAGDVQRAELDARPDAGGPRTLARVRREAIAVAERNYLVDVLKASGGRIDASARIAGVTTRQLSKLLARHAIRKADFKRPRTAAVPASTREG